MRKTKAKRAMGLVILIGLSFVFFSCAVNPVTGEKELSLISASQEKALGE